MSTLDSFIKQWSTTPAANGTTPNVVPYGWPENQAPSSVNNCARQNMADHRYQWEDAEWFCRGEAVSKVSGTSFKIATDVTATYLADRRIKIFDTATAYATVINSSYSAPDTTINIQFDNSENSLGASFTAVALGILSPTNPAIPRIFSSINSNLIIGGDFQTNLWQRGTSFTAAGSASGQYTADRFCYAVSGTAVGVADILKTADAPTIAQAGFLTTSCLHHDVTTLDAAPAATDYYNIQYRVEGYDFNRIAQRTFTLSFWVKSIKTGIFCVAFVNSGQDRSYVAEYTINTTNTWEYKTITVTASPSAGTWDYTSGVGLNIVWTIAAGSNFQTTANAWNTGDFLCTSNQVNGMDSTSNDFKLALIQVTPTSIAYPFLAKDVGEETDLQFRYYQKSFASGTAPAQNSGTFVGALFAYSPVAGQNFGANIYFKVNMRTTPTITTYNPSAANANWRDTIAGADRTVTVGGTLSEKGTNITGAAGAVGNPNFIHWSADAEL